jgi:hypothetical protein
MADFTKTHLLAALAAVFLVVLIFSREHITSRLDAEPEGFDEPSRQTGVSESSKEVAEERVTVHKPKPAETPGLVRMPRVCLQDNMSDEYYRCRREALLRGCSEICDTSIGGEPSRFFNFARKHVDCAGVWMNEEIDASASDKQWPPPAYPPNVFIEDFRQHGNVEVKQTRFLAQRYSGGDALVNQWTVESVESMVQRARHGQLDGNYGQAQTNDVREGLRRMDVAGKRILVIGSENPWVEACVLEAGAAEVWTLEYGRIVSTHPKIKTLTPDEAREMYIKGTLPMFDSVVTFSSVEHSGLGRYGDALNPWGDMQAIARAWCVTKPGGKMLLGVMECGKRERDSIEYNLHRCYRKVAYTHLTANWEQEHRIREDTQPVMVFRKAEALAKPRNG